jgi:hypothetical protein
MRRVVITGTPPQDWVDEADAITQQLIAAPNEAARKAILNTHEGFWRDDRIRSWLLSQFANKCWYTEAEESVSSIHVDHFRPKGRVTNLDGTTEPGYWWLTFNWKNYVIAGQLINTKKKDYFPLVQGVRAAENCPEPSLKLEAALLINPLTDQTRLISFERDDDGCIAVPAGGIDEAEEFRATHSIDILGLNRLDRLNQKRGKCWDECMMEIANYKGAKACGAQALTLLEREMAIVRLKAKIAYKAEFSSVAEACIRKKAPEPVVASVFS